MNLYQLLNTKTGKSKTAEVKYIAGKVEGFPTEESVYAAAEADPRLELNRDAGAVRINPDYKPEPKTKSKPATKRGPVTSDVNQNEHAWAMLNDRELTPTQLAIGMRIHYYAFAPSSGGKCEKAKDTLAAHCGVSEKTFSRAAKALVERGYFKRTDTGQGGVNGSGKSTYVPTLPSWMNS